MFCLVGKLYNENSTGRRECGNSFGMKFNQDGVKREKNCKEKVINEEIKCNPGMKFRVSEGMEGKEPFPTCRCSEVTPLVLHRGYLR